MTAHLDEPLVLDRQDGAAPPVQPVGEQPISLGSLIVFALPAVAVGLPTNLLHFYYLKFATDILLLAPATVGLLFGAS